MFYIQVLRHKLGRHFFIIQQSEADTLPLVWATDVGRYPTTVEGLRALVEKPTSDSDGWLQPYLSCGVPTDPWGNDYVYRYPGQYNQEGYDLSSYGPDRKLGGDDDITNWTEDN